MVDKVGEVLRKFRDEIEASEGYKISIRLKELEASLYIFQRNYVELRANLEVFNDADVALVLWDIKNRDKLTQYQQESLRLLHNFLASVKSLVDHSRILAKDLYCGTDFLEEYQNKVDEEFINYPLACFVQDLRNYILHKGLPLTNATLSFGIATGIGNSINLDVDSLKKWDKWKSKSKEFLSTLGKTTNLADIINSYGDLVNSFYQWFYSRIQQIHNKEFSELKKLQKEMADYYNSTGMPLPPIV